jgi:hypothetical protein
MAPTMLTPNNKMHLPNETAPKHMYIQRATQEQTSSLTRSPYPSLSNNEIHIHTQKHLWTKPSKLNKKIITLLQLPLKHMVG